MTDKRELRVFQAFSAEDESQVLQWFGNTEAPNLFCVCDQSFREDDRRLVILECDGEGLDTRVGPFDWEMVSAIDGAVFILRDLIEKGTIAPLDDQGILERARDGIARILKEAQDD